MTLPVGCRTISRQSNSVCVSTWLAASSSPHFASRCTIISFTLLSLMNLRTENWISCRFSRFNERSARYSSTSSFLLHWYSVISCFKTSAFSRIASTYNTDKNKSHITEGQFSNKIHCDHAQVFPVIEGPTKSSCYWWSDTLQVNSHLKTNPSYHSGIPQGRLLNVAKLSLFSICHCKYINNSNLRQRKHVYTRGSSTHTFSKHISYEIQSLWWKIYFSRHRLMIPFNSKGYWHLKGVFWTPSRCFSDSWPPLESHVRAHNLL